MWQGSLTVVLCLGFCRRDMANRLEEATVVEPVDSFERRALDVVEISPGTLLADQFCLEDADTAVALHLAGSEHQRLRHAEQSSVKPP